MRIGSGAVTVVVAAAGYGKTTAVRAWLAGRAARWCTGTPPDDREPGEVLVVRDPTGLPEQPPDGPLVLVSRLPLGGPVARWRRQGRVADVGPARLSLDAAGVAEVLAGHDLADPGLVRTLLDLTEGWPALVRLAAGSVAEGADPAGPDSPALRFVTGEMATALSPAQRRLALDLAELEWATEELVLALGHRDGRRTLGQLAAIGVVRPVARARLRVVPLVAAALRGTRRRPDRHRTLVTAARWYADHQEPGTALRAALATDDPATACALVTRAAGELLDRGEPATLCRAVQALPGRDATLDEQTRLRYAEALHMTGDIDASMRVYQSLDPGGPLPAGVAWRYGMARCLQGEPAAALDVLVRGEAGDGVDGALRHAWSAAAHWRLGDAARCGRDAERAHRAARALGDGRALAAAHIALALRAQLDGDRPAIEAHYDRALAAAEAAGDTFSIVRIRTNRASSLGHEARYGEALRTVEPAIELAESAGYVAQLAPALCNRGHALTRLGRLDEAVATLERAAALYQRLATDKLAYALVALGDVYRLRGRTSQARAVYEEAVRAGTGGGEWAAMIRAQAGLARVLAGSDPAQARALAETAVARAPGPLRAVALLAAGSVAVDGGEPGVGRAEAGRLADAAAEAARRHRDRASLAEALELAGRVADDPVTARRLLTEALGIWSEAGADLDADRVRVALAGPVEARLAADRLAAAGVVPGPARGVASDGPAAPDAVRLYALGRFAVSVGGTPVPLAAWRSRKARDLLRVLVARRGRAIARDELAQLLWPDEPADRVAHRLSVALSEARAVLDPGRRAAPDHFIAGDAASLALNRDRLSIDAETFDEYARYGLDCRRAGRDRDARAALDAAERAYTGDFLDDEPYDDHAAGVREQLRATFLQATRALAGLAREAGEPDEAVRCLLRLLGADPYDEPAHRDLVDVLTGHGRHGEARRAWARFVRAMREIGVDA